MKHSCRTIGTKENENPPHPPLLKGEPGGFKRYFQVKVVIIFLLFLICFCPSGYTEVQPVQQWNLANGLKVIAEEKNNLPLVSLQLWVKTGSAQENKNRHGISHFLEHLIFKGTEKWGLGQISREVEARGGEINAGTSREYTYYYLTLPVQDLEWGLDILSESLTKATFPAEEIERERLVILEEIKRKQDNPQGLIWDLFFEQLYSGGPYSFSVLGREETLKKIDRPVILEYYRRFYRPENSFLVAVGDFQPEDLKPWIEKYFLDISTTAGTGPDEVVPSAEIGGKPPRYILEKDVQQVYLLLGFKGPPAQSEEQYAADVCACLLGKGKSSRLYQKLREKEKLVWDIQSSFLTLKERGPFYITGVCEAERTEKVEIRIVEELRSLREKGPTGEELKRAKNILESEFLFENETAEGRASILGYYDLVRGVEFVQGYLENINRVTAEEVRNFLQKYFNPPDYTLVMIKPTEKNK